MPETTPTPTSKSIPKPVLRRVLLTNDDGIDAPGLAVLESIAASLAEEVWIVAPETDQSGTSHSISLHSPLRATEYGPRRFGVNGTPGDCVVMAQRLMRDTPPDLVLSGVNRGGNLGVETVFSGTVGAAMTATLVGLRAMALSQTYKGPNPIKWETGRAVGADTIRRLLQAPHEPGTCLNINFPDVLPEECKGIKISSQGNGLVRGIETDEKHDPRNQPYYWLRFKRDGADEQADSETAIVRSGYVSVTPLRFERTDPSLLSRLRADFEQGEQR